MNTYQKALKHYGINHQASLATEECAELIVALNHYFNRERGSKEEVITELADVFIMFKQLREYFGPVAVDAEIYSKLKRLEWRIEANK